MRHSAFASASSGSGRVALGIIGDGDFLMANTAVWTAAHYGLGMLLVVCNNHSFCNDELHQERGAKERTRPVENKWIGQRMSEPVIDSAQMAGSMGVQAIGPITRAQDLDSASARGLAKEAAYRPTRRRR